LCKPKENLAFASTLRSFVTWSSCAKCLKNGIINGSRAACGGGGDGSEKGSQGEEEKKINKIIISHFSSVNQIMIC
jgi:hypothetical protein